MIILPNELEVLRLMQPLDRDVFYYLAERMDYKTGMTGKTRRVSYGGMAYDLSEHDGERRCQDTLQKLSIDQVRNSVRRLINQGILKSLSKKGKGNDLLLVRVFYEALVGLGNCVQKPDARPDARQMPGIKSTDIDYLYNIIKQLKQNDVKEKRSETRPDARPDAITSNTQHTTYSEFSMTMDWQPSADELEMALHRAGFSADKVDHVWIIEFVSFWSLEKNRGRQYTQHGWTIKLSLALIDYLRNPGLYEQRRGTSAVNASPAKPKAQGVPEWARIPRDDEVLQSWAINHGYGGAEPGWSYLQYRNVLRTKVENRLSQFRRLS